VTANALAFLAGVVGRLTMPAHTVMFVTLALVVVLVLGCLLRWRVFIWTVGSALVGWALAWGSVSDYQALRWPESRAGERVLIQAIVDTIPVAGPLGLSFDASVRVSALSEPLHVRLLWRNRFDAVRPGERWQLLVSLRPPRAHFNPGAPDMELHLFRDRVHALATVVHSRLNTRLDSGHRRLAALRGRIVERIRSHVADRDAAALIAALAVGSTGEMSRDQWRVFNATGTSHLVAISGSHVTMFAVIALAIARRAWRAGVWRLVNLPRETFASLFGLVAAAAYSLLAGFSVPTQRTLLMLAAWLVVRSTARVCGSLNTLGIALVAVLLIDPFAPLAAGFWLSFAAVAAIICITQGRIGAVSRWRAALHVQLAVSASLVPVALVCFASIPVTGVLINFIAIPFFGALFVPIVLLAVVFMPCGETITGWLLDVGAQLYAWMWPVMAWAADWPFAVVRASPPMAWYGLASVAIAAALLPWPVTLRAACLAGLLPLASAPARSPPVGAFELTMLDVGARTAVVLRTAHRTLIYGEIDARVENILQSLLISRGVQQEDVTPLKVDATQQREWSWDDVRFRVFCPTAPTACVLHVSSAWGSVLLTDSLDSAGELELVRRGLPPSDIAIVPRHGSNQASAPVFIAATQARWALLSGSAHSRHGLGRHEIKPAVARWRAKGARVLATADSGAIQVSIDPVTRVLSPTATRENLPALWRALP